MKIKRLFLNALLSAMIASTGFAQSGEEDSMVSGELQVGKAESVILYFGEESGDYAGYCFANNSQAGRAILAKCKNGGQCEIKGKVNHEAACKVPGLEATLSASGKITKVSSVKAGAGKTGAATASKAKKGTIERLAKDLSEAFAERKLTSLDAGKPYQGMVEIVIEHSISGEKEIKKFKTLKAGEQWFGRSRKDANLVGNSLVKCAKGVCTFSSEGMLHNTLYLQKITYAVVKGRPLLKTVYFLDGD